MKGGFLPISRNIFDHRFWCEDREYSRFEAWIDLIKSARFEDGIEYIGKYGEQHVMRGQLVASVSYLAKRWKWGIKKVRIFLDHLMSDGMINVDTQKGNTSTVVTICNYEHYNNSVQSMGKPKGKTGAKQGQSRGNNNNKVNKDNNTNLSVSSGFCYSPPKRPEEGDCKGEVEKDWRKDYETYLAGLRKVYIAVTNDPEYIAKQGRLNPGVDVKTTLEKACVNFWATEAGWKHKKAQRTKELDWERTLTNAISQPQNKVYYERGKKFTTGSERAAERRESRAEMGKLAVAILSRSADPQDG